MKEYRRQQKLLAQMMLKQLRKEKSPLLKNIKFGKRKATINLLGYPTPTQKRKAKRRKR